MLDGSGSGAAERGLVEQGDAGALVGEGRQPRAEGALVEAGEVGQAGEVAGERAALGTRREVPRERRLLARIEATVSVCLDQACHPTSSVAQSLPHGVFTG